MPFSNNRLNLPDAEETIAFRAVELVLRNDPVLQSLGTRFATWIGDADDTTDPTAGPPYLMLLPEGLPSDWETEGQHRMPLSINLLAVVEGTNTDDIMNFYGAIRRALFPSEPTARDTVRAAMVAAGITSGTLSRPAYGFKVDDATGSRLMVANGSIEIFLLINT